MMYLGFENAVFWRYIKDTGLLVAAIYYVVHVKRSF